MHTISENDGLEFRVRFFDASGARPAIPETVHWRLDCETTGRELQGWTALDPETVAGLSGVSEVYVDLDISGQLNRIQQNRNKTEVKTVQVVADKDGARQYSDDFQYAVRNMRGRP